MNSPARICWERSSGAFVSESSSDWIEKALAHEQKGVRGVYNKAEYLAQRHEMLQWWADLVDAQIEDGRKVVIGRFGKAFQAA